jgi:uncharacterized repeat protein (TIGR03803 family)
MTILFSFNGTNGATPRTVIQGPDLNFYGVTGSGGTGYSGPSYSGNGTIFKITPGGAMSTLLYFDDSDGSPFTGLLCGSDGCFYGTTMNGGTGGSGTVFRLSVPLAPVIQTINQRDGSITFSWSAVSGQTYQVQYRTDFDRTNWNDLGNAITATNGVATSFDTVGPGPQRLYRVRLVP